MKLLKIIILIIFTLNLVSCKSYKYDKENSLIINEIGLNEKYVIGGIKDEVIGLTMFLEYGRPNIDNTNTIIGAHSGFGVNAYFNRINELKFGDEMIIIYDNNEYRYMVVEVLEVDDTDLSILNNKNESTLTLLTCKIGDNTKRIVVVSTKLDK